MIPSKVRIRPILPEDGPLIAEIIRQVLVEFEVPRKGSAFTDTSMEALYTYYQAPRSVYWVLTDGEELWGGGGLSPLENGDRRVCELQKMYFSRQLRGLGWGDRLIRKAMARAHALGYDSMYLETMPHMKAAQNLYRRHGFQYLDRHRGRTGHTACTVWMEKEIDHG